MSTFAEKSQETNAIRKEIALQDAITANLADCRDCGKKCFWASRTSSKPVLMDIEVNPRGSWLVVPLLKNRLQARYLNHHDKSLYPSAVLRTSHQETCPKKRRSTVAEAGRSRQLRESA